MAAAKKISKRRSKIGGGHKSPAIILTRIAVRAEKLVYLVASNRHAKYGKGRSRLLYIGTTSKGVDRILSSVAEKARQALSSHGTRQIDVHVYTVAPRRRVKMWQKLEQGLILAFKDLYGCVPKYNTHGKNMIWGNQGDYVSKAGLKNVIRRYE